MTIQYDSNQTPEKISRQIYNELLDLPDEIKTGLQKLLWSTPIIKTGLLVERKNPNSVIMDVSDLEDSED